LECRTAPAVSVFQQGVDSGFGLGVYGGGRDCYLDEGAPNANNSAANPAAVRWSSSGTTRQSMICFGSIIGNTPGQVPPQSHILNAYLRLRTDQGDGGDGGRMFRMLIDWPDTLTWNQAGAGTAGFDSVPGVQANGTEARISADSQVGTPALDQDFNVGWGNVNVTRDIQAWADGEPNHGWVFIPWSNGGTQWRFRSCEAGVIANRPELVVHWATAAEAATTHVKASFQEGIGGYLGTVDTRLTSDNPNTSYAGDVNLRVAFAQAGSGERQTLLRFDNLFGPAGGQIPVGSKVQLALLTVNTTSAGDGAQFRRMLLPWSDNATWNSTGGGTGGFNLAPGVQPDGVEASNQVTAEAGDASGSPNYSIWSAPIDVIDDINFWAGNPSANNGWAILPWLGGTQLLQFSSSEESLVTQRPRLTVYYSDPPTISSATINSGAFQRSRVTSAKISFDQPVSLPPNPAAAFELRRQSDNAAVALTATPLGNSVTLTFTGGPVDGASLADGRYTLKILASQVNNGNFDGNGDGTPGDDFVLVGTPANGLFRLFGDFDGDGDVDAQDFGAFRSAFGGTTNLAFDFDGDGDVDASDFGQFRTRFGNSI